MSAPELLAALRARVAELRTWFGLDGMPVDVPCQDDYVVVMLAAIEAALYKAEEWLGYDIEPEATQWRKAGYVLLHALAYGPHGRGGLLGVTP